MNVKTLINLFLWGKKTLSFEMMNCFFVTDFTNFNQNSRPYGRGSVLHCTVITTTAVTEMLKFFEAKHILNTITTLVCAIPR